MSADAASATIAMEEDPSLPSPRKWLAVGAVGLLVSALGFFVDTRLAAYAYLSAMLFVTAIVVGMLFLVMIHHIFDAGWSVVPRRQAENFLAALPYLGLLFIPLFLVTYLSGNQGAIWLWMDEAAHLPSGHGTVGEDILYQKKLWYLSEPFFWARAVVCFGAWIWLALAFRRHSFAQDADGQAGHTLACRKLAAAGLFVVSLTWTFFGFDWIMSLEYHWFSTIFGVWFFSSAVRAALAALILASVFLYAKGPYRGVFTEKHLHDLATLSFAFTVFWGYITFSQYFLIWNANIPEETFWYNYREHGMWWEVSMFLIFGHFLFPFLFMLQYPLKVSRKAMAFMASWLLFMQLFDIYFNVMPALKDESGDPVNLVAGPVDALWHLGGLAAGGGILLWAYWSSYRRTKLIPVRDPRILESLEQSH